LPDENAMIQGQAGSCQFRVPITRVQLLPIIRRIAGKLPKMRGKTGGAAGCSDAADWLSVEDRRTHLLLVG